MVIIWINGAFGSGKTQTAFELHRRLKPSYVYDPEKMGFAMRSMIPPDIAEDDFQSYPLWREFNYSMLSYLSDTYQGIIIVPMTITNDQYFHDIISRLRQDGRTIHHFTLLASKETLLKRLRTRAEGKTPGPQNKSTAASTACLIASSKNISIQTKCLFSRSQKRSLPKQICLLSLIREAAFEDSPTD